MNKIFGNINKINLLRVTLLSGLIIVFITVGVLAVFHFSSKNTVKHREMSFNQMLGEYDITANLLIGASGSSYDKINFHGTEKDYKKLQDDLLALEKKAVTVESWLSVLKRRRFLANIREFNALSVLAYHNCIERALEAYPMSQPINAVAASAYIKDKAVDNKTEQAVRNILPLLDDSTFAQMRLYLHILLGDFNSPQKAMQITNNYLLLNSAGAIPDDEMKINLALIKILNKDTTGALNDINSMLNETEFASEMINKIAAEIYYDFGDIIKSAQVFSLLNDDESKMREADALFLAGYQDNARAIWTLLTTPLTESIMLEPPVISNKNYERCLYNLAVTSKNNIEAASYLDNLIKNINDFPDIKSSGSKISNSTISKNNSVYQTRQAAVILYSRMLDQQRAVLLLESLKKLTGMEFPYVDIEILKRNSIKQEAGRQAAQTWMLLDNYPSYSDYNEICNWAAWKLFYLQDYKETGIFLRRLEKYDSNNDWLPVYISIQKMLEGDIETAQTILQSIPENAAGWHVNANVGRIHEAMKEYSRALEQYELAMAKNPKPKTASVIQYRIAKCLLSSGSISQAGLALQYALDLDSENQSAKLELHRLSY